MARLSDKRTKTQGAVPVGDVIALSTDEVPAGYLLADGAAVSRATYARLFAKYNAAGLPYGVGDGSTTFNLPDLRGEFLRGADNGRNIDTAGPAPGPRGVGSAQGHQYGQHVHGSGTLAADTVSAAHTHPDSTAPTQTALLNAPGQPGLWLIADSNSSSPIVGSLVNGSTGPAADRYRAPHAHPGIVINSGNAPHGHPALTGSTAADGGTPNSNETRPRNVAVNYAVKY
jgi:microcystin-dependent protein